MTVVLRTSDGFADRLLADARDGLEQYQRAFGGPVHGDILDIGAHYGSFALAALEAGASWVLCVEAAIRNYTALCDNMLANDHVFNCEPVYAAALESEAATVAVRRAANGNSGQHSLVFHEGHPVTDGAAPVVTFSTLLARRALWRYVKIDIEGGEWSLLNDEAASRMLIERAEFVDLEIHPLDAPEYYPPTPRAAYRYVDEVGEWFRERDCRVTWTAQHPTRLFVVTP